MSYDETAHRTVTLSLIVCTLVLGQLIPTPYRYGFYLVMAFDLLAYYVGIKAALQAGNWTEP